MAKHKLFEIPQGSCQMPGCRQKATHLLINGGLIYGVYCAKHGRDKTEVTGFNLQEVAA